jgi:uncharacterized protein
MEVLMSLTAVSPQMRPVQPGERIQIIDILRGFALFGILLVNMALFREPIYALLFPPDPTTPFLDRTVTWLIHFLAEGKFYTLFSLLFGLGFAIQFSRAEERHSRIVPLYMRRLFVLLLIGLVHAFLIWTGDILIVYALLGFPLILFRKARPKTLLIWIGVIMTLYVLVLTLALVGLQLASLDPALATEVEQSMAMQDAFFQEELARAYQAYSSGSFMEVTQHRIREYLNFATIGGLSMLPTVFSMFLLGLYFGKRRLFMAVEENLPFFRKLLRWGLIIGLPLNLIYATAVTISPSRTDFTPLTYVSTVAHLIGAPALSLAYVGGLTLLSRRPVWGARLQHLAPTGRMALTNYLMQSIICTLIFYSYGLGLIGQVGATVGLLLTIVIFALQVLFSRWWMERYRYGPAEWLWRSLTYLRPQPMTKAGAPVALRNES